MAAPIHLTPRSEGSADAPPAGVGALQLGLGVGEAGPVVSEKRGRNIWYSIVPPALESLRARS